MPSSDITTPSQGKIEPNHGTTAPNHGTIAPTHETIAPNHGKIDKHKQKSISLSELHLFHSKFGHISIDSTISILRSQNYIISESMRKSFFCNDCALNKSQAKPAHSLGVENLRSNSRALEDEAILADIDDRY